MRDEYEAARKEFAIAETDFALAAPHQYRAIMLRILDRFTDLGRKGLSVRWWWESFKGREWGVQTNEPLNIVAQIVSPTERYWLLAETWMRKKKVSQHWVYDATGDAILRILNETGSHEYYIVEKKMTWLLCYNHHNILIACGTLRKPNQAPEPTGN